MNGITNLSLSGLLGVMNSNSGGLGNEVLLLILAKGPLLIFLSNISFISAYSIPIIIIVIIIIIIIIIIIHISLCKKTLQQRCIDFDFQLCRAQATQWGWEGTGRIGLRPTALPTHSPTHDRSTHELGKRGGPGRESLPEIVTAPGVHLPPHRVR